MKSPKMPTPSAAEQEAAATQASLLARQTKQLDDEEARRKAKAQGDLDAISSNKVGMRSLLSGDWQGYQRGGDLGARA